eukprot:2330253-Pleurochrysis_carterae.AAC.1
MSQPSEKGAPTSYTWEYLGEHKSEEELDNVQVCSVGSVLKHDVFGLCTLLDSTDAAPGSFK